MALTQQTIDDLKKEAKELETKLSELDQEAAKIQRQRASAIQEKSSLETIIAANLGEQNSFLVALAGVANTPPQGRSFRDTIREVIKESGAPMMPKQVETALLASGFEESKEIKTPLGTRIGNELFKLAKNGVLERVERGYVAKE